MDTGALGQVETAYGTCAGKARGCFRDQGPRRVARAREGTELKQEETCLGVSGRGNSRPPCSARANFIPVAQAGNTGVTLDLCLLPRPVSITLWLVSRLLPFVVSSQQSTWVSLLNTSRSCHCPAPDPPVGPICLGVNAGVLSVAMPTGFITLAASPSAWASN